MDLQSGNLSRSGTITAVVITIGQNATVNPGNSPGTLIMMSNVDFLGTLQTEVVDTTLFDVQGTVTMADTTAFAFLFDGTLWP